MISPNSPRFWWILSWDRSSWGELLSDSLSKIKNIGRALYVLGDFEKILIDKSVLWVHSWVQCRLQNRWTLQIWTDICSSSSPSWRKYFLYSKRFYISYSIISQCIRNKIQLIHKKIIIEQYCFQKFS